MFPGRSYAARVARENAQADNIIGANVDLIAKHDNLARKIRRDLAAVETELDALQNVETEINNQGHRAAQVINSYIEVRATDGIPTVKSYVSSAKRSISG